MKDLLKQVKRYFTNAHYEELKAEWEEQNIEIDMLTAERNGKQDIIDMLSIILDEKDNEIEKLLLRLDKKEKQRRATAGKLGGYKKEINNLKEEIAKLKDTNEFLRNNRRAPNIEEIKDYELRRKKRGSRNDER